jgi:hypothetical protein
MVGALQIQDLCRLTSAAVAVGVLPYGEVQPACDGLGLPKVDERSMYFDQRVLYDVLDDCRVVNQPSSPPQHQRPRCHQQSVP